MPTVWIASLSLTSTVNVAGLVVVPPVPVIVPPPPPVPAVFDGLPELHAAIQRQSRLVHGRSAEMKLRGERIAILSGSGCTLLRRDPIGR
jgi:hypothetical protein